MNVKKLFAIVLITVVVLLSFNSAIASAAPQAQMPMPGQFYVVRPGDTLYSIAARFHTTTWAIAQVNGIVNPSLIYAGQALLIPAPSPFGPVPQPPFPASRPIPVSGPVIHLVRSGENLSGIARMYGVSMWQIAYVNGLANPNYIYAGQRLLIPVPSLMPSPMPGPVYNPWGGSYGPYPMPYGYGSGMPSGMPVVY